MRFASLGSGSRGNGSIVASQTTIVLVDCGFQYKEALARLKRLRLDPEDLDGILVTHEHSDHVSGVEALPISTLFQSTHRAEHGLKSELIDSINLFILAAYSL